MTLVARDEVRANMAAVTAFARNEAESEDCDRCAYFESLNLVQQYKLRFSKLDDGPLIDFSLDDPQTGSLLETLRQSSEFDGPTSLNPVALEDIAAITNTFRAARDLLRQYSSEMAQIVDDLIAWIIVIQKDGYDCGSMWHALGAIWMSPGGTWTTLDYAENLLHEAVHQAMLLDDMVHSLFAVPSGELSREGALVTSSIREIKRPYDFAFHAATVSVALIDFHERAGDAERALQLARPLILTLRELDEKRHLLSSRGKQILADMIRHRKSSPTLAALSGT